jgi:hypothetical protein
MAIVNNNTENQIYSEIASLRTHIIFEVMYSTFEFIVQLKQRHYAL